ncbi:hypothetical protein BDV19DRAFT_392365 [Aspergillus venezuelensis]
MADLMPLDLNMPGSYDSDLESEYPPLHLELDLGDRDPQTRYRNYSASEAFDALKTYLQSESYDYSPTWRRLYRMLHSTEPTDPEEKAKALLVQEDPGCLMLRLSEQIPYDRPVQAKLPIIVAAQLLALHELFQAGLPSVPAS